MLPQLQARLVEEEAEEQEPLRKLKILLYNVDKSGNIVKASLLRDPALGPWDIIAIQEPWKHPFQDTTHHPAKDKLTLLYPDPGEVEGDARVRFFLNDRIDKSQLSYEFITRHRNHHHEEQPPTTNPSPALADLTEVLQKGRGEQHIIVGDLNIHHLS
ncbi:MAG: hypothetical protein LQ349_000114 [Xanthoria aureola]|nr:MAG: hypothetical protein LQ349_000114 [Xanthoria aureola]